MPKDIEEYFINPEEKIRPNSEDIIYESFSSTKEQNRKTKYSESTGPLPIASLPSPSIDIAALKASKAKYERFIRTLGFAPFVGASVSTKKGDEQWTLKDAADIKEYRRRERKGEFIEPLPLAAFPRPSCDLINLRASRSKYRRIRKALGSRLSEGISVETSKSVEQWTSQDVANLKEYNRRQKNRELTEPLPIASLPSASVDIVALKASKAKYGRFIRALGFAPFLGISISTKKGDEQWTLKDATDLKEYGRRERKGEFMEPLPLVASLRPSCDLINLRASMSKYRRIRKVLVSRPSEGVSVETSKGVEQWTSQDVVNLKEYNRRQKTREFTKLTLDSPSSPSGDIMSLKASRGKYERFRKALGSSPSVGVSISTSKGEEQWTSQDAVNFKEYLRKQRKGEFKVHSASASEATNTALTRDNTVFFIPGNSDKKIDISSKEANKAKNLTNSSKKSRMG